jgi:uncharacterized membrane protein YfcA
MSVEHWYLLPVGFGIAFLAMSSGISAGNFWVPVYLFWSRFEPPLAFWMTLATMLCGYGSGVVRNLCQGTFDRRIVARYLPFTMPAALIGGYLAPALNVSWLLLLFGIFVFGFGVRIFVQATRSTGLDRLGRHGRTFSAPKGPSSPQCGGGFRWEEGVGARLDANITERGIGLLGGLLLGLITVGLGELLLPRLLAERKSLSPAQVVGSTVLVIFVTSLAAALARLNGPFLTALGEQRATLLGALVFAGPGVILGGQLGPMMARGLNMRGLRWYVAVILLLVSVLMLVRFLALSVFAG